MKFAAFFGHLGMMCALLGVILALDGVFVALAPAGAGSGFLFLPLIAWIIGLWFVIGEYFEIRHPD